jgi:uncharacterized protein YdeI (YjbR/CyaY-like superfamily)
MDDLPIIPFASQDDWAAWLDAHHDTSPGLWIKIAKAKTGIDTVTHAEALDVALCFGWIDGQRKGFDDIWFLQRFTPRRPRSVWSKINTGKATALIAEGRMQPAGLREIERAKADGRWDAAYAGQRTITVPDDLAAALKADRKAKAEFDKLDSRNRYAILYRVQAAKKAETRARRIEQFVAMLARGERIYP